MASLRETGAANDDMLSFAASELACLYEEARYSGSDATALARMSALFMEKCAFLRLHLQHAVLCFHERPALLDLIHDGALALGEDGVILDADRVAAELLESGEPRDLIGQPINAIFDTKYCAHTVEEAGPYRIMTLHDLRHGRRYYGRLHADSTARPANGIVYVASKTGSEAFTLEELAGEDPRMLRNIRSARRVADSRVTVLIQGPTGSGKEAFAHALHLVSRRASQPFIAVNCAAIPETLIESELFGYRPGAFTGARREGMRGRILQSSGGTLFLDEIGDMPLTLQTRLLRVLEEQQVVALGSETPTSVDLHVMAASHRNLRDMIQLGAFREDLYYRLNGITFDLPPLAGRADRELIIRRVLAVEIGTRRSVGIESETLRRLLAYSWPGNVRELRNVIRTALAICENDVIRSSDLPAEIRAGNSYGREYVRAGIAPTLQTTPADTLRVAERSALLNAINACQGNMTRTAGQLGMSRNTLYRKMKSHGIPSRTPRRSTPAGLEV